MDDIAEFLPIKLSPGFISVAFHLGCIGCNFCSVRYGNSRDLIFTAGVQKSYPTCPGDIVELLASMPSFHKARIPIRLGNDTDLRFELDEAIELLNLLPQDYPATALTRFPIRDAEAKRLARNNLIVKLTATPSSSYLNSPDNASDVIESVAFFDTPVVLTIGPVTADNFDTALKLVGTIPKKPNVTVYIKPLNSEFHHSLAKIPQITAPQYDEIRRAVKDFGYRHLSQLMCPVNDNLRIRHKRVSDVPLDERIYCQQCSSQLICYTPDNLSNSALQAELSNLGLCMTKSPTRNGFKSYSIDIDAPTGFGDEAYLSEMLGCKVKLSGTRYGTASVSYSASRDVMTRWDRLGFFPYFE